MPLDDGADRGGRRDVVVRRARVLAFGGRIALVDGLDLLGQQRRIGGYRESPAHTFHGGRKRRQGTMGAVTDWQAPTTTGPVHATVTVPGSKSQTNRALVLAALATAEGASTISGALRSR